jgi:hypothetical protein
MALPLSGPLKMGDIRTELGMSVSNFSLTNASIGGVAGYPTLNTYSFYRPNSPSNAGSPYKISEWYGYDHSIGYVVIDFEIYDFICSSGQPDLYNINYSQTTQYYNKFGTNVASPYNISINGILALTVGSFFGIWNSWNVNECQNTQNGAFITPTSVVITGTPKKVWVDGTGFL